MIVTVNGHGLRPGLADKTSARTLVRLAGEQDLRLTVGGYGGSGKAEATSPPGSPGATTR